MLSDTDCGKIIFKIQYTLTHKSQKLYSMLSHDRHTQLHRHSSNTILISMYLIVTLIGIIYDMCASVFPYSETKS